MHKKLFIYPNEAQKPLMVKKYSIFHLAILLQSQTHFHIFSIFSYETFRIIANMRTLKVVVADFSWRPALHF